MLHESIDVNSDEKKRAPGVCTIIMVPGQVFLLQWTAVDSHFFYLGLSHGCMDDLPFDCLVSILQHLDCSDLALYSCINSHWKKACRAVLRNIRGAEEHDDLGCRRIEKCMVLLARRLIRHEGISDVTESKATGLVAFITQEGSILFYSRDGNSLREQYLINNHGDRLLLDENWKLRFMGETPHVMALTPWHKQVFVYTLAGSSVWILKRKFNLSDDPSEITSFCNTDQYLFRKTGPDVEVYDLFAGSLCNLRSFQEVSSLCTQYSLENGWILFVGSIADDNMPIVVAVSVETWQQVKIFECPSSTRHKCVKSLDCSMDGDILLGFCGDTTLVVWKIQHITEPSCSGLHVTSIFLEHPPVLQEIFFIDAHYSETYYAALLDIEQDVFLFRICTGSSPHVRQIHHLAVLGDGLMENIHMRDQIEKVSWKSYPFIFCGPTYSGIVTLPPQNYRMSRPSSYLLRTGSK